MDLNQAIFTRFGVPKSLLERHPSSFKRMFVDDETMVPAPPVEKGKVFLEGIITSDAADLRYWGFPAVSLADVRKMLKVQDGGDIELLINSPGGDIPEGSAIAHALKEYEGKRMVMVTGLCASVATYPLLTGDSIAMAETAELMVHNPYTCACGDAAVMRTVAKNLEETQNNVATLYAKKTGKSAEEMTKIMQEETYLGAESAVEMGFADEVRPIIPASSGEGNDDNGANRMEVSRSSLFRRMAAMRF